MYREQPMSSTLFNACGVTHCEQDIRYEGLAQGRTFQNNTVGLS
jgi:hypothetical protein